MDVFLSRRGSSMCKKMWERVVVKPSMFSAHAATGFFYNIQWLNAHDSDFLSDIPSHVS